MVNKKVPVQPLNLPLTSSKNLLNQNQLASVKTGPKTETSGRLTSAPRDKEFKEFEENLPSNCYFRNEKRSELPHDPVKLIKLKIMKSKTEKNLISEIDRLADQNRSRTNKNKIPRMKQTLSGLEKTILEKQAYLNKIRNQYKNVSQKNVNTGRCD
jgi:hypothetical protein